MPAGVTTLLIMVMQTSSINALLPPVSYPTAIDLYTSICFTFVFAAFVESVLVNYASRSDMHQENMKKKYQETEHDARTELLRDGSTNFAMVSKLNLTLVFPPNCLTTFYLNAVLQFIRLN